MSLLQRSLVLATAVFCIYALYGMLLRWVGAGWMRLGVVGCAVSIHCVGYNIGVESK